MISEREALDAILAAVPPPEVETVPLCAAVERMAASDVFAALPLPGFDNSSMDGWAIHEASCGKTGVPLRITGEQPAGANRGLTVRAGEAVRIFTGAPLPAGTGAVVMQEDAEADGNSVFIRAPAEPGEFIRRAGSDVCAGQLLIRRGDRLTPQRIGVLASQGRGEVACGRRPRAAIVCTGEELVAPGLTLPHPGALYNSNGPMLAALLRSTSAADTVSVDTVRDDLDALKDCFRRRLEQCDVLMIAGGVSVGDHDLVKPALQTLGIAPQFWRVAVKPGKPFLFCTAGRRLIFGLPGNPVSAYVTALLFVLPALRRFAGAADAVPHRVTARAATSLNNKGDRTHYLRGIYDAAAGTFSSVGSQESHAIAGLSRANALARLEPGAAVAAGEDVLVLPLG
jgi:molybdopterin molybdotransferase